MPSTTSMSSLSAHLKRNRHALLFFACIGVMWFMYSPSVSHPLSSSTIIAPAGSSSSPDSAESSPAVWTQSLPQEYKKVLSFSLFSTMGKSPRLKDTAGLLLNIAAARQWYPKWTVRAYIAESFSPSYITMLRELGAEVVLKPDAEAYAGKGMTWRMQAFNDQTNVIRVMPRDADSRLNPREAWAAQEWEDSGAACMTIRDHKYHSNVLQGGMWGCIRQTIVHALGADVTMADAAAQYWEKEGWVEGSAKMYGADQDFLGDKIWPLIAKDTLVFCSHHCELPNARRAIPFARPWTEEYFVGAYSPWNGLMKCDDAAEYSQKQCSFVEVRIEEIIAAMLTLGRRGVPPLEGCAGLRKAGPHSYGRGDVQLEKLVSSCQDIARTLLLTMASWLPGFMTEFPKFSGSGNYSQSA